MGFRALDCFQGRDGPSFDSGRLKICLEADSRVHKDGQLSVREKGEEEALAGQVQFSL